MDQMIYGMRVFFRLQADDTPKIETLLVCVKVTTTPTGYVLNPEQSSTVSQADIDAVFRGKTKIPDKIMDSPMSLVSAMVPVSNFIHFVVYSTSEGKAVAITKEHIENVINDTKFRADRMHSFWQENKDMKSHIGQENSNNE